VDGVLLGVGGFLGAFRSAMFIRGGVQKGALCGEFISSAFCLFPSLIIFVWMGRVRRLANRTDPDQAPRTYWFKANSRQLFARAAGLFGMLNELPFYQERIDHRVVLALVSFVTSSDSGSLVVDYDHAGGQDRRAGATSGSSGVLGRRVDRYIVLLIGGWGFSALQAGVKGHGVSVFSILIAGDVASRSTKG